MKKLLCLMFLIIFALSHTAFATEQVPDILIVEGKTYYVKSWTLDFPLESFFAKKTRPRFSRTAGSSVVGTNCWRGYIAIWSLASGKLNLVSIDTYVDGERRSVKDIVGDKTFADWFSGTIKVTDSPLHSRPIRSFVFVKGILKKERLKQEKIFHSAEPSLSLAEAVELAKDYIKEKKVDITKHYLDNARLLQNSPWMKGKHWVIEWRLKNLYVDGGMIFVIVGMNKEIKITYGE